MEIYPSDPASSLPIRAEIALRMFGFITAPPKGLPFSPETARKSIAMADKYIELLQVEQDSEEDIMEWMAKHYLTDEAPTD